MYNKKIKSSLLTFIFLVSIFSPYFQLLEFKKTYNYSEENHNITSEIIPVYSQEVSLVKLPAKIVSYKKTWEVSFNSQRDFVVFKFDKSKMDVSDIKIKLTQNNKEQYSEINNDWDERVILDQFAYSEPIFIDKNTKINYEINSKSKIVLEQESSIIWINTSNYSESLAIGIPDSANAEESWIIKRSDWWADETLRYEDNPKWVAIYATNAANSTKPKTARQLKQEQRIVDIRQYLAQNFSPQDTPVSTITEENWHQLVWPIEKTEKIEKIFIHHTAETTPASNTDDTSVMRAMYYYHTITRWWWDIWYNYVVWRDGKIYEWRAWWNYNVAAHTLRNNKSTVGISAMWNFETNKLNNIQKNWIDKAIWLMSKKYWIDLNKTSISHKECASTESCLLRDYQTSNLSGHRDAWATACPWANLYSVLPEFRETAKLYSNWLVYINNSNAQVEKTTLPKWPTIKIKLSFDQDTAEIKSFSPEKMKIQVGNRKWTTNFKYLKFEVRPDWNIALVVGKRSLKVPSFSISSTVLEVSNWARIPTWDKSGNLNDNKFRWTLTIFNDDGKLAIMNELPLEDYLKWLAEISNTENEQKAKTILVSARSYALWYTDPNNRKFIWKPYDWSDDPDVFQKYLGYGFEQRSTNIWKYINDTNWIVIKYDKKLIKPWYFNQSSGKTRSYLEYCKMNMPTANCTDNPYLQSVADPGITDWTYKWHWVWISWNWAKALADQWKTYNEIIKYFLTGVSVEKTNY